MGRKIKVDETLKRNDFKKAVKILRKSEGETRGNSFYISWKSMRKTLLLFLEIDYLNRKIILKGGRKYAGKK